MEWSEIIISIRDNKPHQIAFIKDCIMEFVEPFEVKHHYKYFKLGITTFKSI